MRVVGKKEAGGTGNELTVPPRRKKVRGQSGKSRSIRDVGTGDFLLGGWGGKKDGDEKSDDAAECDAPREGDLR